MKNIAIIGITGSIGLSTVEVIRKHSDQFRISLATSHNKARHLLKLADEFNIPNAIITKQTIDKHQQIKRTDERLLYGPENLFRLLEDQEFDIVINAVSGSAGLIYSHHILKNNQPLALANKESLVMAGHLLTKMNNRIIPVDSEHSALFQIMEGLEPSDIKKAILTASGGPFLNASLSDFKTITPKDALKHPTWSMGAKITIDSATMFNKGLEVIEAHWLFGLDYSQITAVIHPQSIIHSMIECRDGSILSQMSKPSMQLPILYALSYPNHIDSTLTQTNLCSIPSLTFQQIDKERYPLYYLMLEAGRCGGLLPTAINAANEAAIKLFFENRITFNQIFEIASDYLDSFDNKSDPDIETILNTNDLVFNEVYNKVR